MYYRVDLDFWLPIARDKELVQRFLKHGNRRQKYCIKYALKKLEIKEQRLDI